MMRTLGGFIRDYLQRTGTTQAAFAERADVARVNINRLVREKVALPDADTRRKIARAMGVSHLDILVAAGELEPNEVEAAGVRGVVEERPTPGDIASVLRDIEWTPQATQLVAMQLHFIRDSQRGIYNVSDPREGDRDFREE